MKVAVIACLAALGCGGEGRAPDRPPPSTPVVPATPPAPGSGSAEGSAAAAPSGSVELVAAPADVASGVVLEEVAHGLDRPVLLVAAPGDARRRLFILEQHKGTVRVLEGGRLAPTPVLTIGGLATGAEQGLLGLAFHPAFTTNGRFYVNFTTRDKATHIVEYTLGADGTTADPKSARELARIAQPYSNHNGGHLELGPDGKLYAGMGDGGAANDPQNNGQDPKALLGKMLRFDVDAAQPVAQIVHRGLRNPWRFAFDSATGDLFIGDVGQNLWEYVHVVGGKDSRSHNFGWNIVEGSHCFDAASGTEARTCDKTGLTLPVVEYPHAQGCSITGGRVYRGKALPRLAGHYFYSDFCTGLLRSFVWKDGAVRDHWDWKAALDTKSVLSQISSFGADHDGELYVVSLLGGIYKLAPAR